MLNALTQVLPFVVGLIAAPLPIVAVILLLMAPAGRGKALAFVLTWAAVVLVVSAAVGLAAGTGDTTASGESPVWVGWAQLLLGLLLLLVTVKNLRDRLGQPSGTEPEPPAWLTAIGSMGGGRVVGLAVLLAGANPKSLAMILGGGAAIAAFDLGTGGTALAALVFAVLGSLGLLAPVVAAAVWGERGAHALERARSWLTANNDTVTMTVLFVFGGVFAAKGLGVLLG
ncbi:GAP family protein [Nocardiopsis ganjiahuensis]|uniref:GAP family protein n=1 Tax=Nocardiopsis ganjiahuensis TaxID=239984 RepID=UPI000345C1AF|nr:GAP family protein [Nocardiopsis ganjiahuensis]